MHKKWRELSVFAIGKQHNIKTPRKCRHLDYKHPLKWISEFQNSKGKPEIEEKQLGAGDKKQMG